MRYKNNIANPTVRTQVPRSSWRTEYIRLYYFYLYPLLSTGSPGTAKESFKHSISNPGFNVLRDYLMIVDIPEFDFLAHLGRDNSESVTQP